MKRFNIIKTISPSKHRLIKNILIGFSVVLIFCLGGGFGLSRNPKYLSSSEQQAEISSEVSAQKEKIQGDYNNKSSKLQADYNTKISDIQRDYDRKTSKTQRDYDDKVSKIKKDSDKSTNSQLTAEKKKLQTEYDQKLSDAKKSLESNQKTKTIEKKVPTVPSDCETIINRYNYLFKLIDVAAGNSADISSSVVVAHGQNNQALAKSCLMNTSFVPRGVIGGKANQILWDNWK